MGFFESGITPAWTHVTAMFYNRQEQGARCTVWFAMNGVAAILGGLLSYGIGHTHTGVEQWQLVSDSSNSSSHMSVRITDVFYPRCFSSAEPSPSFGHSWFSSSSPTRPPMQSSSPNPNEPLPLIVYELTEPVSRILYSSRTKLSRR